MEEKTTFLKEGCFFEKKICIPIANNFTNLYEKEASVLDSFPLDRIVSF
jgi:hypothetical protein